MEENKIEYPQVKKKNAPVVSIILAGVALVTTALSIVEIIQVINLKNQLDEANSKIAQLSNGGSNPAAGENYRVENVNGKDYYVITGEYSGDYDLQFVSQYDIYESLYDSTIAITNDFNKSEIMSYNDYSAYCKRWGFNQKYTNANKSYAVLSYVDIGSPILDVKLADVEISGSSATLYVWDNAEGVTADVESYLIVVPVNSSVKELKTQSLYNEEEFALIKRYGVPYNPNDVPVSLKPLIYLYPEEKTKVSVSLGYPDLLTTVYPAYNDGWSVMARPDGTLTDLRSGRELYSLYWEGKAPYKPSINEGFVVSGEDSAQFLEDKLHILGLTDREAEEFIVYWLPKLESSPYNLIRFETTEEIEKNMPLSVSPKPATTIRVMMDFVPLEEEMEISEQVLPKTPERKGFTVVEWGGAELSLE